ncbi:hypothetical protein M2444_001786 [Paenibacillus sp. PastF-3]|nr:hypothetical protein [Paenibacillus sp. PastF-3]
MKGKDAVKQIIYVVVMNRKHLAEQASGLTFWLTGSIV